MEAGSRHFDRRRSAAALAALAATFALGLTGCGDDDGNNSADADRDRDTSVSPDDSQAADEPGSTDGAGTPGEPVQIRRVLEASGEPAASPSATPLPSDCDAVAPGQPEPTAEAIACDKEGVVYRLGPAEIVGGVNDADAKSAQLGGWLVLVRFDHDATAAFADLTAELGGTYQRVAILSEGAVVAATVIENAITNGKLQISGDFDQDEARALVNALVSGD